MMMDCCREIEAGQQRLASLQHLLQAEPTFQMLRGIISQADAEVYAQLEWQELIEDGGWELVQRGDVVQQWLAQGHAATEARPVQRRAVPQGQA